MDHVEYTGSWEEQKSQLKQKLEFLTRNGMIVEDEKEKILEKLQARLGISKEELRKIIEGF